MYIAYNKGLRSCVWAPDHKGKFTQRHPDDSYIMPALLYVQWTLHVTWTSCSVIMAHVMSPPVLLTSNARVLQATQAGSVRVVIKLSLSFLIEYSLRIRGQELLFKCFSVPCGLFHTRWLKSHHSKCGLSPSVILIIQDICMPEKVALFVWCETVV